MAIDLKAFMANLKVGKGMPITHTTKGGGDAESGWNSGSYYIPEKHLNNFMVRYQNLIATGCYPTVTEMPRVIGPLRIDFDFSAPLEVGIKRQYSEETIKSIVLIFQDILKKSISPTDYEKKMLSCIVLEKKAPRSEFGVIKDGFHLHFPYFICESWVQDKYVYQEAKTKIIESGIWKGKFITPVDEIIDTNIARKPWMMYGSMNHKTPSSTPYMYNRYNTTPTKERYGHAFDHECKEVPIDSIFKNEMGERKNKVKYYLPYFLSIRRYNKATILSEEVQSKKPVRKTRKIQAIKKTRSETEILEDIKIIKDGDIMSMISDDRSSDRDMWMDLGWTLFNVGQGHPETLEMWIEFSKKNCKFKEGECEELWLEMELKGKTIASLLAMAKNDSPDLYNEWKNTHVTSHAWESLKEPKPVEYDIAQVVNAMYSDRFICANSKSDIWYEFRQHRWRCMDDGNALKKLIVTEVVKVYCDIRRDYDFKYAELLHKKDLLEKGSPERDEVTREMDNVMHSKKRCSVIISTLKTDAFLIKVIKMCKLLMYDSQFITKLDENRNLLCCENGVLDLDLCIFRDGRPDDRMTFSTGIDYKPFREGDEEVADLDEYLMKVYVNPNLREYFLNFMASCLQGGNVNKRFLIATGPSDGAKSMTFKLIGLALGEGECGYFGKFPRELIVQATGKNSSSGARPELSRVKGKRIMSCQEITKNEKVNIGFIKEATGNDSFYSRGLYKKGEEINPQFTLMMQCLTGDSAVSLPCGFSIPIDQMRENETVMGYHTVDTCIDGACQTRFLNQGVKNCVEFTTTLGQKITCTPDHRFLCTGDTYPEWKRVSEIDVGKTMILSTVRVPHFVDVFDLSIEYEMEGFDLKTIESRLKLISLCRLAGRKISINELNTIVINTNADLKQVLNDVYTLSGDIAEYIFKKGKKTVFIPVSVTEMVIDFCLKNPLGNETVPLFAKREILASMMGAYQSIRFSKEEYPNTLKTNLEKSIYDSFKIDCLIPETFMVDIAVYGKESYTSLMKNIGVRYNSDRSIYYDTILNPHEKQYHVSGDYPVYADTVIDIKHVGEKQVYDITVSDISNFVANGFISHNCNEPPDVPGQDEATWSRIRVLDHQSKFVKPQDLEKWPVKSDVMEQMKEKRFKADPTFSSKLDSMAPVFLWRLFERYKIYKKNGLPEPKEVMVATDQYQTQNDVFSQFINTKMQKSTEKDAPSHVVKLAAAFTDFKEWYKENYPSYSKSSINKMGFKKEMTKRLGTVKSEKDIYGFSEKAKGWKGYSIIDEDGCDFLGDGGTFLKIDG